MILLFSFIGEFFRMVIPLPVPASVYGLVLLLAALLTGVIKLDQVEGAADFLIEIMPVMFIPAAVGLRPYRVRCHAGFQRRSQPQPG